MSNWYQLPPTIVGEEKEEEVIMAICPPNVAKRQTLKTKNAKKYILHAICRAIFFLYDLWLHVNTS